MTECATFASISYKLAQKTTAHHRSEPVEAPVKSTKSGAMFGLLFATTLSPRVIAM